MKNDADVNELHTLIPLAMGMVISPLPIVAMVAILLAPRGRASAPVYTAVFTLVAFALAAVGAVSAGAANTAGSGNRLVSLAIGVLLTVGFAVLAAVSWHGRPRNGEPAVAPKWLAAIDTITPASAAGLGLLMAATSSKNIALSLKAGSVIGEAHLSPLVATGLCIAVALAGSVLLIIPALVELTGSAHVHSSLVALKGQLIEHNAAMMTVVFAILAANEAAHVIHRLT